MIQGSVLTEKAHLGLVTCISAAVGRVWTSGGSSAFVCLKEWGQSGQLLNSTDLRSVGERERGSHERRNMYFCFVFVFE